MAFSSSIIAERCASFLQCFSMCFFHARLTCQRQYIILMAGTSPRTAALPADHMHSLMPFVSLAHASMTMYLGQKAARHVATSSEPPIILARPFKALRNTAPSSYLCRIHATGMPVPNLPITMMVVRWNLYLFVPNVSSMMMVRLLP